MICFPNAKINLGLFITEKRSDGYHNLETVFYPIPLCDTLEFVPAPVPGNTNLQISGIDIDGDKNNNLVIKAYNLLADRYDLPAVDIYLHKTIPFGAGLGGGSADAAFMLKSLNNWFKLKLTDEQLENYARLLGADCAFFVKNKPVFAYGRGDEFLPVNVNLSGYYFVLVKPVAGVSTQQAYSGCKPQKPIKSLSELVQLPVSEWRTYIKNDFEKTVFPQFPEIEKIKQELYNAGAVYASMSGSGSSVYGLFTHQINATELFNDLFVYQDFLK